MKKSIAGCIVVMCMAFSTKAQSAKSTENINQLWFGYFNQARFSDKWGTWLDFQLRTKENFVNNFSQSLIGLGLTYYLNDATRVAAGYTLVDNFASGDKHKKSSQIEHQPWQHVQWQTNYGKKRMIQRFRLEERYRRKISNDSSLVNGYNFSFRMRYSILYDVPLSKKGIAPNSLSFVVNDEALINFGREIINNYFDQNRLFVGLKYQIGLHNNLQVGYMNVFQQLGAGYKYKNTNALRLFYFQNFDLRKNKI